MKSTVSSGLQIREGGFDSRTRLQMKSSTYAAFSKTPNLLRNILRNILVPCLFRSGGKA